LITLDLLIFGFYAFDNPLVLIILADFWLDVYVRVSLFDKVSGVVAVLWIKGVEGFLFNEYGFVS
jgi:hypothetical protein